MDATCLSQSKGRQTFELNCQRAYTWHQWPRSTRSILWKPSAILFRETIVLVLVFTSIAKLNQIDCLSIISDQHSTDCEPLKNTYFEIIEPKVVLASNEDVSSYGTLKNQSNDAIPLTSTTKCTDSLRLKFSGFNNEFVIDLVKNKRLISDRYFEISKDEIHRHGRHPDASSRCLNNSINSDDQEFHKNHLFLNLHNFTSNNDHCHYHGPVNYKKDTISAISIVHNSLLSGFFHDGHEFYYLYANTTNSSTIMTKSNDLCSQRQEKTTNLASSPDLLNWYNFKNLTITVNKRSRRAIGGGRSPKSLQDNRLEHGPFQSNSSSLFVELLIVHDHNQYTEYKRNSTNIAERTMQIVNIMNAFYRQLNIFVALVGVVLWVEKDEIELTEDGDATLTNFLKYRYEKLLPKYAHDNAQLITSTSFNGSVVGKALKGPICTHEHSGGVNTDHSHSPAIVAVTLAHELGHNFGMEHDEEDKCKCTDEKCIMSSSSSTVHPKHWSSCSVEYLEEAKKHGLLDCLMNRPKRIFGPVCGNGFVEEGEDCDIGEPIPTYGSSKSRKQGSSKCAKGQDCDLTSVVNTCCDRQTCKFTTNATCAQGPCCDLNSCKIYNATENRICREKQGECDLEEKCDGKSEYCPTDVYYHDGIECGPAAGFINLLSSDPSYDSIAHNRSRAYCYHGKCASHESQCQLLWGPSGTVSRDLCYEQNVHGNTSGNCGYNRLEKTYSSCEPEDAICGMLHCVHNQPSVGDSRKTGKLGYGFESASVLTVSFFVMSSRNKIYCHGAIIDAGSGVVDPGLVPNGAACGDAKMCLNQKCVTIYDTLATNWCPSDCNGNGVCDNLGVCHCNDGTIGTSCYQFFGPNFHLSLFLYIFMFFGPVIALIVFTINHYRKQIKLWWFLHNRKIALAARGSSPVKRIPLDMERSKINISEPIPLNQHSNTNRPFYEPNMDPWAETDCDNQIKSPGFRLEPITNRNSGTMRTLDENPFPRPMRIAPPPPVPNSRPHV